MIISKDKRVSDCLMPSVKSFMLRKGYILIKWWWWWWCLDSANARFPHSWSIWHILTILLHQYGHKFKSKVCHETVFSPLSFRNKKLSYLDKFQFCSSWLNLLKYIMLCCFWTCVYPRRTQIKSLLMAF
jgi:hypothetical protein